MSAEKIAFVFGALMLLGIFFIFLWLFPYSVLGLEFPLYPVLATSLVCIISVALVAICAINRGGQ